MATTHRLPIFLNFKNFGNRNPTGLYGRQNEQGVTHYKCVKGDPIRPLTGFSGFKSIFCYNRYSYAKRLHSIHFPLFSAEEEKGWVPVLNPRAGASYWFILKNKYFQSIGPNYRLDNRLGFCDAFS
ncbi:MAG: hypothetical protein KFF68_01720 [Desulfosarcina sp.]|nr:hypothetical protein [Desulfosarcina sp.]